MKPFFLLCFFLLFSSPLALAAQSARQAYNEADAILQKMHLAVVQLDKAFKAQHPENLASRQWIQLKLENMAIIDQLIRRTLMENTVTKDWPLPVKRSFVNFFFNLDARTLHEDTLGYAQRNDLYNYQAFKRLLEGSPKITPYGWPVISQFGAETDYYAFLIAQHGQSFDPTWQTRVLIPRLERLAAKGETAQITPLWLADSSLEFLASLPPALQAQGGMWETMLPEVQRMRTFFSMIPRIMQAERITPFNLASKGSSYRHR